MRLNIRLLVMPHLGDSVLPYNHGRFQFHPCPASTFVSPPPPQLLEGWDIASHFVRLSLDGTNHCQEVWPPDVLAEGHAAVEGAQMWTDWMSPGGCPSPQRTPPAPQLRWLAHAATIPQVGFTPSTGSIPFHVHKHSQYLFEGVISQILWYLSSFHLS